jgi:Mg-chelatase subunit ChlI
VDVLLDSAASGWNTVEREGISISHPARFILVGSGNPEEGELRPQLLDRFGMHAQVGAQAGVGGDSVTPLRLAVSAPSRAFISTANEQVTVQYTCGRIWPEYLGRVKIGIDL